MTHSLISRVDLVIRISKNSDVNFWKMTVGHLLKVKREQRRILKDLKYQFQYLFSLEVDFQIFWGKPVENSYLLGYLY